MNLIRGSTVILQVATGFDETSVRDRFADAYMRLGDAGSGSGSTIAILRDFQQHILQWSKDDLSYVNRNLFVGAAMLTDDAVTVWFNNQPYHMVPVALNLVHEALVQVHLGTSFSIRLTNAPLPYDASTRIQQVTMANQLGNLLALNVPYAMAFVMAFFVLPYVRERANRANLLQFVSGAKVLIYWGTALLFDYATFVLTAGLLLVVFAIFQVGIF